MIKIAAITLIIFISLTGFNIQIYSQSNSNINQDREAEANLRISTNSRVGETVIYTNPNRNLAAPEIQMI